MNVRDINMALSQGIEDQDGLFPHLDDLRSAPYVFKMDFGLGELPEAPGVLLIRGARQYGKSTWLEGQIRDTVKRHGPGSAYYLNGDEIPDSEGLVEAMRALTPIFKPGARVHRIFIDEITAIRDWQKGLKQLLDAGELRRTLVVTTGSKATDLRRGGERLPGRKGRLDRTAYLFTPVSYCEFKRVCGGALQEKTLPAYVLSGGSPVACAQLAQEGRLPEFVLEMTRDWVYGECAAAGRSRHSLLAIMEYLARHGSSPLSQAGLARETGLANNTVAAGYIELLSDLLCLATAYSWDSSRRMRLPRRPCKYPFINLLAAVAWHPEKIRRIDDLETLPPAAKGSLHEWVVAQEIWRRRAKAGEEMPEVLAFWQGKHNELDFVLGDDELLEVKAGGASPLEFSWFPRTFPKARLKVVNLRRFEAQQVTGVTLEDFLLEE
ncbi:MAG: ATP-binding protein [Planctomycetes bacterium]|nr:ATP-binding protein [Planctomycetota bacterium]